MKWTLHDVAAACDGSVQGEGTITSVSIDSRTVEPGALFVAVRGEHHDGHAYLDDAIDAGAAAVMVGPERLGDRRGVEVDDTVLALLRLAEARREEITCPVIAVTGSNGKTTTKDFIGAALGGSAHRSLRSFNNEFGVPLTVLGTPDTCDGLVIEVGSRGRGHIASLANAIRPSVSVITNVGRAHLEMFGSVEGVAIAKWELVEALGDGGLAVLPFGEELLANRTAPRTLTFGEHPEADMHIGEVRLDALGRSSFVLSYEGQTAPVSLAVPGRHQPLNAAAAVAAAVGIGRTFTEAASRLGEAEISPWRMDLTSVSIDGGSATIVNDAYNANPDSLRAALDTVASMPGRHIAVLGKMHELGPFERAAHEEAGSHAADLGFTVVVVGDDPGIASGAGSDAVEVVDADAATQWLKGAMLPGDVVLIKASRAAGLETIATAIEGVSQ